MSNISHFKLGDICTLNNGCTPHFGPNLGNIPVISAGKGPITYYHNIYNVEKDTIIIIKYGGNAGYVLKADMNVFVTNYAMYVSNINESLVDHKYLYYILKKY